ncbi:preprotein translocase subunit SecG [Coxiella-like endosymbiont]|uniref:preprotein translocase subunit SecG n=1 Tax=Coxiella-like endosymbiont TaxID=1592897 RepID=UPI00272A35FD|nr:preprotein translocase subunit SecG [Coxiella-like endosymbiont]
MQSIIIIHVMIAVCLIGLVLLQHGKGADAGTAFGSGASNTMFGSTGATPFLMKVTIILAAGFFATSIGLSYLASRNPGEGIKVPPLQTAPLKNFQPGAGKHSSAH